MQFKRNSSVTTFIKLFLLRNYLKITLLSSPLKSAPRGSKLYIGCVLKKIFESTYGSSFST